MDITKENVMLSMISPNNGQISGLPKNPRKYSKDEISLLSESIKSTPLQMDARPLIVTPFGEGYVVLGGNMRIEALRRLKTKETPCYIVTGATVDDMKQIVMKDNSHFGEWDTDEIANGWDDLPLDDWGVCLYKTVYESVDDDPDDEHETVKLKLKFSDEEYDYVTSFFSGKDAKDVILELLDY